MRPRRLVTIDGPAGSGKTTLGRRLATALEVPLIDTGVLYRAVTVCAARAGIRADDGAGLAALARSLRIRVDTDPSAPRPRVMANDDDITDVLHDPALAPMLATVSGAPEVRAALLAPQRELALEGEAVAVGRDCGTVVFTDAPLKLYLDAPAEVRMRRRRRQLGTQFGAVDGGTLTAEVETRDHRDASRDAAPMRAAGDAHLIRTDEMDVEQMVAHALALCERAGIARQ